MSVEPCQLRRTPLYDLHAEHGGSLAPWHGCEIPTHYQSILDEHRSANEALALFDLGYRAMVRLEGAEAGLVLDELLPFRASLMEHGELWELPMLRSDGTVIDMVKISRLEKDVWNLVFSNPTVGKNYQWIKEHIASRNCRLDDLTSSYAWVALSGNRALDYLLCSSSSLERLEVYHSTETLIAGVACLVRRWGHDFFEIACRPELLGKVIHAWWASEDRPLLCGWASYENWRLERGILRQGCEIKEGVTPFELGLEAALDFEHEGFIGREALLRLQGETPKHLLVHFSLEAMRIPRAQAPLYCGGRMVGLVCAGGFGSRLNRPIGSAWVSTSEVDFDSLEVEIRRQRFGLKIRKPPLW